MTRRSVCGLVVLALSLAALPGDGARAQAPAGFELTLVEVDGTKRVLGQLPPTVYAPRISPDGKRVAFETRDPSGPDGPRLWTAELSNIAGRRPLTLVAGAINSCSSSPANVVMRCIGGAPMGLATPNT